MKEKRFIENLTIGIGLVAVFLWGMFAATVLAFGLMMGSQDFPWYGNMICAITGISGFVCLLIWMALAHNFGD